MDRKRKDDHHLLENPALKYYLEKETENPEDDKSNARKKFLERLRKETNLPVIRQELEKKLTKRQRREIGSLHGIPAQLTSRMGTGKNKAGKSRSTKERGSPGKFLCEIYSGTESMASIVDMECDKDFHIGGQDNDKSLRFTTDKNDQKSATSKFERKKASNADSQDMSKLTDGPSNVLKKHKLKSRTSAGSQDAKESKSKSGTGTKSISLDFTSNYESIDAESGTTKDSSASRLAAGKSKRPRNIDPTNKSQQQNLKEKDGGLTAGVKSKHKKSGESQPMKDDISERIKRYSQVLSQVSDKINLLENLKEDISMKSSLMVSDLSSEKSSFSSDENDKGFHGQPLFQKIETKMDSKKISSKQPESSESEKTSSTDDTSKSFSEHIYRPAWQSGVHDINGKGAFDWQRRIIRLLPKGLRISHIEPSFRFDLPLDLKLLETMSTKDYLVKHCRITSKKEIFYDRPFIKNRPISEDYIFGKTMKNALTEILIGSLTEEQYSIIKELVNFTDEQKIFIKLYRGICALTERLFFEINFGVQAEEAYSIQKGYLEQCDFRCLDYKLKGVHVKDPLNKLIHLL